MLLLNINFPGILRASIRFEILKKLPPNGSFFFTRDLPQLKPRVTIQV